MNSSAANDESSVVNVQPEAPEVFVSLPEPSSDPHVDLTKLSTSVTELDDSEVCINQNKDWNHLKSIILFPHLSFPGIKKTFEILFYKQSSF